MFIVMWFLLIVSIVLLIPVLTLFFECLVALLPSSVTNNKIKEVKRKIAVLIPAHNEASGIETTIKSIVPQLNSEDSLVVIADNCTDETATIARNLGATTLERNNSQQRGKGYALDYGIKFLHSNPPDVLIVVDADCVVHQKTIENLSSLALASNKPVQGVNLINYPANPQARDLISALAFMLKNLVRPLGLTRMGFSALLTGTGMALPWVIVEKLSFASANIVEDMQLSVDLNLQGDGVLFCPDAKVTSSLPSENFAATTQRTRWEHGHLQTLIKQVPRLFQQAWQQKRLDLLAFALDLSIPPLSFLVLIWLGTLILSLLVTAFDGRATIVHLLLLEGWLIFLSIFSSWFKFGRQQFSWKLFLSLPFYLLWKIPIYLKFVLQPQSKWIRTERT